MARKPSPKPKHVAHSRPAKAKAEMNAMQAKPHTPMDKLDEIRAAFQSHIAPYVPAPLPPEATRFIGRSPRSHARRNRRNHRRRAKHVE